MFEYVKLHERRFSYINLIFVFPGPSCHESCNGKCWGPTADDCQIREWTQVFVVNRALRRNYTW